MERADQKAEFTWTVRPVDGQTVKGFSALLVMMAVVYGAFSLGGVIMGFLSILILAGGTGPFFVKTRYRLTPTEVAVTSPFQKTRRPWGSFRQAYIGVSGVSLSPFRGRHLLEAYRSVMLRYGDHRDEVLDWVKRFGPEQQEKERGS